MFNFLKNLNTKMNAIVSNSANNTVPYAVNSAKVDANGYANFITKIDNNTIGFDTNSGATPIVITYPDGSIETNITLPNITNVLSNGTYFIVKEKGGIPYLTYMGIESYTQPLNPQFNQFWLDISVVPYVPNNWNGSAWIKTQFVKLGEFTKTAGVIGTPISYALNGRSRFEFDYANLVRYNANTINHNIGTNKLQKPVLEGSHSSYGNGNKYELYGSGTYVSDTGWNNGGTSYGNVSNSKIDIFSYNWCFLSLQNGATGTPPTITSQKIYMCFERSF